MKKILITSLPGQVITEGIECEPIPTLSVYLLGSILKEKGYSVKILDQSIFQRHLNYSIRETINKTLLSFILEVDIICFSVNTFSWCLTKIAISEIRKIKKDAIIVLGGLHPTIFFKHILNTNDVDYIVRGEGEISLPMLIESIRTGGKPDFKGIAYKKNGNIIDNGLSEELSEEELSNQPFPLFEMVPKDEYSTLIVEASRGCFFNCKFCSIPHRNNWRPVKVESIIERVNNSKLKNNLFRNTVIFNFVDDCFTANPKRVRDIFEKLESSKDGFKYFIEARINDFSKTDCYEVLKFNIVKGIQFGVECGYDEGLIKINKGTTVENLYKCAEIVYKKGLAKKSIFSFIIGFPWESYEDIQKTLDTMEDICYKYGVVASINWLILLPSRIWEDRKLYGIDISENYYDYIGWINNEDLFLKTHPSITKKIYLSVEKKIFSMISKNLEIAYTPIDFNFRAEKLDN